MKEMFQKDLLSKLKASACRAVASSMAVVGLLGIWDLQATPPSEKTGPFVVLLGAPASGKTTHGDYLGKKYRVPVVRATEVLERAIRRSSSYSGSPARKQASMRRAQKARTALDRLHAGELVDDETLNGFIANRIWQRDCRNGFVIDGYPNSVDQAAFLESYLEGLGVDGLAVVYLDIPDEVALARMQKRRRVDDTKGFGKERLRQFRSNISSVLEFYEGTRFLSVDTTKEVTAVDKEIVAFLEKH